MIDNHSYRSDGFPFITAKGHNCMDSGFALVFQKSIESNVTPEMKHPDCLATHALLGFAAVSHPNTTQMKINRRWLKKIIMTIPGLKRSIANR